MEYRDKYATYLEEVPTDIARCKQMKKHPVFGYTSNLDVLLKWDVESFNSLLEEFSGVDLTKEYGDRIEGMSDFVRVFGHCAVTGQGGGGYILDGSVCTMLEQIFESDYGLGGTCAQGSKAMAAMNVPIVIHVTDRSKEVCEYLDDENIRFVGEHGLISAAQAVSDQPPLRHMILQFSKGDVIRTAGTDYRIPASNRLILDFDEVHKIVPIEERFLAYCERNAEDMTSYNVSGFNAIVDMNVAEERMTRLCKHFKKIKAANPACIIYLEGAHYFNSDVKDYVFMETASCIDLVSMNEEELVDMTMRLGHKADISDLQSIISSLDLVLEKYGMGGIIMHTKDYSLHYGKPLERVDIEKGLTLGNLMSGTRARTARYGSYEDCMETLKLEKSALGLMFADQLEHLNRKHSCCLVPSRYLEEPKCTIGLGDTFAAGVQLCFM